MPSRPIVMVMVLVVVAGGSLTLTASYAWYLRSGFYRDSCAAALSEQLGLPCAIGAVVPRSRTSREFRDIRVWLPQRRGEAAFCERAVLTYRPQPGDPDSYDLELVGGWSELSTRTWLREDYRSVLTSGLRPGFTPQGPHRVAFRDLRLAFDTDRLRATLYDASGQVEFASEHEGHATAVCHRFNNYDSARPVTLRADFSPAASRAGGVQLDRVEIVVPDLPVAAIDLRSLGNLQLTHGQFNGRLEYHESSRDAQLVAAGQLTDLQLSEFTEGLLPVAWHGQVPELQLDSLTVRNGQLEQLAFHGRFDDVRIGDVLAPWGLQDAGGNLKLRIREARLSPRGIEHLVLTGHCDDVSLDSLSRAVGWGRITGVARLAITDLTIHENTLTSLVAEITAKPATGQPNTLDLALLSEVAKRALGFTLPTFLPEKLEYAQLGVRLEVHDELLHVFGTHGPGGKIILTIRAGEQEIPVLPEPAQPIDLKPQLDVLRAQLAARLAPPWPPLGAADPWLTWLRERWPMVVPGAPPAGAPPTQPTPRSP